METPHNIKINDKFYQFIDVLRDANVNISTDELLSLFNALPHSSLDDKDIFKQTLQSTLIKDYTDIPVFEKCFNEFFLKFTADKNSLDERVDDLLSSKQQNQELKESGISEKDLEKLLQDLNDFLEDLSAGQLFEKSSEEILSLFLEEIIGEGSSGGMGIALFKTLSNIGQSGGEPDQSSDDENTMENELKKSLTQVIRKKTSEKSIGREIKMREDYLLNKFIYQLTTEEIKEMRELIKRFGQKLKNRISLRKKKVKHGGIDIKRTLRTSMQYGGVPFKIFYKDRKIDRPQLAVLCDISGSVNQYTRFMLLLTHTLQGLFSKVRTFAFISKLVEITDLFREMDPERAINSIFNDRDFTYGWGSNYGKCFDEFINEFSDSLNKKTTILVLGDARNNHQDPGLESFIKMRDRSRNIFWLNPEKIHLWDWSDSIATVYQKYCLEMKEVNNFLDLSEFIDKLFLDYT